MVLIEIFITYLFLKTNLIILILTELFKLLILFRSLLHIIFSQEFGHFNSDFRVGPFQLYHKNIVVDSVAIIFLISLQRRDLFSLIVLFICLFLLLISFVGFLFSCIPILDYWIPHLTFMCLQYSPQFQSLLWIMNTSILHGPPSHFLLGLGFP